MASAIDFSDLPPASAPSKSGVSFDDLPKSAPKKISEPNVDLPAGPEGLLPQTARGLLTGAAAPVVGVAELVGKGLDAAGVQTPVQKYVDEYKHYSKTQSKNPEFRYAREFGELASPVYAIAPELKAAPLVARAATLGALSAAEQPVDDPTHFWTEKAKQVLEGGMAAGSFAKFTNTLAAAAKPEFDAAVKTLMDAGVRLTPGMMSVGTRVGDFIRSSESKSTSLPGVGDAIASAQRDVVKDFNRAVLNKALAPIGETLPKDMEIGREAYSHVAKTIGDKYDALLPGLTFAADQKFQDAYKNIKAMATELAPPYDAQFKKFVGRNIEKKLDNFGGMDGQTFKTLESVLSKNIKTFYKENNGFAHQYADALKELQSQLRGALARSNPEQAATLTNLNKAYATYATARDASLANKTGNGVFSPHALSVAISKNVTKNQMAAGAAHLQDLADAAAKVIPSKIPDSATSGRSQHADLLKTLILGGIGGAGGAAAMGHPLATLGVLGGGSAIAGLYSETGLNALRKAAAGGDSVARQQLSDALRSLGVDAASGMGALTQSQPKYKEGDK